jgi:hypothetical protein
MSNWLFVPMIVALAVFTVFWIVYLFGVPND